MESSAPSGGPARPTSRQVRVRQWLGAWRLACSFARPLRRPLLHPCLYALFGVVRVDQFFFVDLLGVIQGLLEVCCVPGVESTFRSAESCWAQGLQLIHNLLDSSAQLVTRN